MGISNVLDKLFYFNGSHLEKKIHTSMASVNSIFSSWLPNNFLYRPCLAGVEGNSTFLLI